MREEFRHHIPVSKAKCLGYCLFFTLLGVVFPVFLFAEYKRGAHLDGRASLLLLLSPVIVPFFGFLAILYGKKVFDPRSGLLITDEGIFNNSGLFGGTYVKWSEVSAIHLTSTNSGPKPLHHIELRTVRVGGFSTTELPSLWKVFMSKAKIEAGRGKIVIINQSLSASYEEVVEALRTHQPRPIIDERKYY